MPWTNPKTWAVNELLTASLMNLHLRDNLNALKNPPQDAQNITANYTVTSTSFVDIDAVNLSKTIVTTGGRVLLGFYAPMSINLSTNTLYIAWNYDGFVGGSNGNTFITSANATTVCLLHLLSIPAGTHTFKLQWKVSAGTGTLHGASEYACFFVQER